MRIVCADRKPDQRTFIRLHSAPLTTLMVATYVPPSSCTADKGDFFTLLGIMNKQVCTYLQLNLFHGSTQADGTSKELSLRGTCDLE